MKKRLSIIIALGMLLAAATMTFALDTLDGKPLAPGSVTNAVDFANITRGLYYDGNDYYYVLEQGVPATDYLLNLRGEKYYFDDNGKMVKDEIIDYNDEKYYFDPNGTMLKNTWVTHEEVDPYDGTKESVTYYFGPTGRAYRADDHSGRNVILKNIDGDKYGFNSDGVRLEGYVSVEGEELNEELDAYKEAMYFFDPEEGYAAAVGWIEYAGDIDESLLTPREADDEIYLYFDEKTCRKVAGDPPAGYKARVIDGERYLFDCTGKRQNQWYGKATKSAATPMYYNEDYEGYLTKGWFLAIPQEDSQEAHNRQNYVDEEEKWFFSGKNGRIVRDCIRKIGKYYYCFDKDGVMQSDALVVTENGKYIASYNVYDVTRNQALGVPDPEHPTLIVDGQKWMYFTEPEDEDKEGVMCQLNKFVPLGLADDDVQFIANSRGGYASDKVNEPVERNGRYIQNGILLTAKDDTKYGIVQVPTETSQTYRVVKSNGTRIKKRGAYKDEANSFILTKDGEGQYIGTYHFKKCKAKGLTWDFETEDGDKYSGITDDRLLSDFDEYRIEDSSLYLNFIELVP